MNHHKKLVLALPALIASLALIACGGGDDDDTVSGAFEVLAGAPAGYEELSGEAELTRSDDGTTTMIELTGLEPDAAYIAHLHTGGCTGADPGGPHFQFDRGGSDEPPNEIHLTFDSNADGSGEAEASVDREVPPGEAGSVVLHPADGEEMTASLGDGQLTALFVHEGRKHGAEDGEGGHGDHGAHHAPAKIACANLEGSAGGAADESGEGGGEAGADAGGGSGAVAEIEVRDGEPVGGVAELEFSAGEQIRFEVSADSAEEIHVHGYDISQNVAAGGSAEFSFPAEIEGIFEVELEELGTQIAELRVNP